jgi:LPXTG-site transpeptidase (sortase) family protein
MRQRISTKWLAYFLIVIGTLAGAYAVFLVFQQHYHANTALRTPGTNQSAPSSVKPKPTAIASYQVAPSLPKYITIPSIGVPETRVIQLGLTKNNQIAVPDNIYDAGWYNQSTEPGQNGAMFIYGHVSSWQANGIFYNLKKLTTGDKIVITRGDGKTYTYQVVSSKVYPYNAVNMNQVLTPIDQSKPGLNLMTCTGQVIAGTSEFNERLVVFTSLAQ